MRADGVYFNLSNDEYHAEPRLSASGCKLILQSPTDFWVRSWMNPVPEDTDTDAKDLGTAYHCRVIEGREVFNQRYAAEINPRDYADTLEVGEKLLITADDCKDWLRQRGLPLGGKKEDLVKRIHDEAAEVPIWDVILDEFEAANAGRVIIKERDINRIEMAVAHIERHPQLKHVFANGMPEVAVLWTAECEMPGSGEIVQVPAKAKFDYFKDTLIPDLKSFANQNGDAIGSAVYRAMAAYKYHRQAAIYYEASDAAAKLIAAGKVFGWDNPNQKWLDSVVKNTEKRVFYYIFQQTGPAPVAVGRRFRRSLGACETGRRDWQDAMASFVTAQRAYGDDIWVTILDTEDFEDDEFPPWAWS